MPKKKFRGTIILLGRPGSGKGTQAALLAKHFSLKIFGTGDLMRAFVRQRSPVARKVQDELEKGNLAPTWLAFFLWLRSLIELMPSRGAIFDGSPRTVEEAKLLLEVLQWMDRAPVHALLISVSEKEAFRRLSTREQCVSCGEIIPWIGDVERLHHCPVCAALLKRRKDDLPEAVSRRFAVFRKSLVPVIRFFRGRRQLRVINGEQPIESVFRDILKALKL